jgi:hypothetical protein
MYERGKSRVPPSKDRGTVKSEKPRLTIFAEDAILLTMSTVTKKAIITSRYLYAGAWGPAAGLFRKNGMEAPFI